MKHFDIIKDCAQCVYNSLGSGHSEAIYHAAMEVELRHRDVNYSTKAPIVLMHRGSTVGWCIADLILDFDGLKIIVELKATTYAPRSSEKAQLQGYLRALQIEDGCLINFPQPTSTRDTSDVDFIILKKNVHQTEKIIELNLE